MSVMKIRMLTVAEEKFYFQWELQNTIISVETNFFVYHDFTGP